MADNLAILTDPAGILSHMDEWRALHAKTSAGPFSSAEWIEAWFDAYADTSPTPAFGLAWRDGVLVAGWPLGLSKRKQFRFGTKQSTLHVLCDHKAGYHELLIAPGFENIAGKLLAEYRRQLTWTMLDLTPLRDCPAHSAIFSAAESQGYAAFSRGEIETVIADLSEGWEPYLTARSRDFRKSLRSAQRKLENHEVEHSVTTDPALDGEAKIDAAIELSARCWKAQLGTDLASDPAMNSFFRALLRRMGAVGTARLHLIEIDGTPAASALILYANGEAVGLIKDFDESFARLSLGRVLVCRTIDDAINYGMNSFDFLRSTPFTQRFGTGRVQFQRTRIMRRGSLTHLKFLAEEALRPVGRSMRKRKQSIERKRAGNKEAAASKSKQRNGPK